jgi:hypothetical protein
MRGSRRRSSPEQREVIMLPVTVLSSLWLPMLLSAVVVFMVSSVIHMAGTWHKGDYPAVPNQDRVQEALRPFNIPPGEYMLPRCTSHKDMKSPEFTEKLKKGPVMVLTVLPNGPYGMTQSLVLWFVYSLVVSLFAAYVAGRALPPGTPYLSVFRFAGVTAFLGYSVALWQMSIWYRRGWGLTAKATLDGLIYALVTAGIFGWLWPK